MSQLIEHVIRYGRRAANHAKAAVSHTALWFCACTLFVAALFSQVPNDLHLPNTTVTSPRPVDQAGTSVTADNGFIVNGGANVTFIAGNFIHLGPGFHATAGSAGTTFDARIGPPPVPLINTTSLPNGMMGSPYTKTLLATGGVQSYTWSMANGTTLPPGLSLDHITGVLSGRPTTAGSSSFTVQVTDFFNQTSTQQLTLTDGQPPGPLTLPALLKGVNYFPRGHAWWSMLYDWYAQDCTTSTVPASCISGQTVSQVAASDLQRLAQNGFNFIHLYLWDQDIAQSTSPHNSPQSCVPPAGQTLTPQGCIYPGFAGWDNGGPQYSPANPLSPNGSNDSQHNQWTALKEFVSLAKANGICIHLDFAVSRPGLELNANPGQAAAIGTSYANWVNQFIDNVQSQQDVLIWGVTYGIGASPTDQFWQAAYPAILTHLQQTAYPSGRPLLTVGPLNFNLVYAGDVLPILSGYHWTWPTAQHDSYLWQQGAQQAASAPPDLYALQTWNANEGDLQGNLECVAGIANSAFCPTPQQTCGAQCTPIPFAKLVVTEFATGSSLESAPIGNGIANVGDALTPTTTAAGQAQWLLSALCTFNRLGISKYAYFGLYDSASFWEDTYNQTGLALAWTGYWGLASELASYGDKPAWTAMRNFNPGSCPAANVPTTPVMALQADATYYTVNDTATLTYTVANVTSLSLNESPPPGSTLQSSSCVPPNSTLSTTTLEGSCAFTRISATNTGIITLTGVNNDVDGSASSNTSTSAVTSVTVGPAPIVTGLVNFTTGQSCNFNTNPGCTLTASQTDLLEVYGLGFDPSGGNTVQLTNQSATAWFYETDGLYFWDFSRTQINAELGCYVTPPGAFTLYIRSPNSGTPSAGVPITITSSSTCP